MREPIVYHMDTIFSRHNVTIANGMNDLYEIRGGLRGRFFVSSGDEMF